MENLKAKLKGAWKSFTIHFNVYALALIPLFDALQNALPLVNQYGQGTWLGYYSVAVIIANIILRFKTDSDLKDK